MFKFLLGIIAGITLTIYYYDQVFYLYEGVHKLLQGLMNSNSML